MVRLNGSRKRRKPFQICILVLSLLLTLTGAELVYSNYSLKVNRYKVQSEKVDGAFRIVFLSDLHGREFGSGNSRLLKKISAEEPDFIALGGDIFNNNATQDEIDRMCAFIRKASEIAPVYYCQGNHENHYLQSHENNLLERVQQSGAVTLESEFLDTEINGTQIRIGGYMGYYHQPHMMTKDPEQMKREREFAKAFEETDHFKLLLNHIPTTWLDWKYINKYPVDLVLCGHYHGGLVRIPLLNQGLIVPYIGWFPPYIEGMFVGSKATCILTTGLAGGKLPRFFNPPEIVTVDVVPD